MRRPVVLIALLLASIFVAVFAYAFVADSKEYSQSYHVVFAHVQVQGSYGTDDLTEYEVRRDAGTGEFYIFTSNSRPPVYRAFHPDSLVAFVERTSSKAIASRKGM